VRWFTGMVVLGVVMELLVIRHEYRDDMQAWALTFFGVLRTPARPSVFKIGVEVASVLLIAFGIVGELWIGITIASINTKLRGKSAVLRSKNAELRIDGDQLLALVNERAVELEGENLKLKARLAWRTISKEQELKLCQELKDIRGASVAVEWLGSDPELATFGTELANALHRCGLNAGVLGEPPHAYGTGLAIQIPQYSLKPPTAELERVGNKLKKGLEKASLGAGQVPLVQPSADNSERNELVIRVGPNKKP
jgi:hypothetical protein